MNCGYCQLPFIPYTFPGYEAASQKNFFIGRDTNSWCEYDSMFDRNNKVDPCLYLANNASFVSTENIIKDWKKPSSFWGTVGKLQLQLRTGVYHPSIEELSGRDREILNELGYGNLYSIELSETLKRKTYRDENNVPRNEYQDITDQKGYEVLQQSARPFEQLKTIFEAYGEPDYVFVLSWVDADKKFFEGLDYKFQPQWYLENLRAVYLSKSHKTKIVWTDHPHRFSFLKMNQQEMCSMICETVKELEEQQRSQQN